MLIFAPLFRSGQPALAVLVLELLAVLVLALVLWTPRRGALTGVQWLALMALLALPLVYLLPLPEDWVALLPGRAPYLAATSLLPGGEPGGWVRVSLVPLETESALLFLLVPIAVFLGTRLLDARLAGRLVAVLLGMAALQALLGLLQYGAGAGSPEIFGISLDEGRVAVGTYTNRNHLAGLLNMVLPIALGLTVVSVGRGRGGEGWGWRGRVAFLSSVRGHEALLYGAMAALLLLGVIFTRSRGGILLAMVAVLLSTILFSRRIGGDNVYGPTGTIIALVLGVGVTIGLVPVLDRFSLEGAIADARWEIFSATLAAIGTLLPVGSGPGNYPEVFPAFQPASLGRWFVNHAHNDYLEWLFEGGLLVAALIALLLILYARQWPRVWGGQSWTRFRFVQVGAGIGVLLLLLHSLVEYNLQIPANVIYFAFLCGIFFADPVADPDSGERRRRRRRTPDLDQAQESAPRPTPGVVPPDQIRNPFLD